MVSRAAAAALASLVAALGVGACGGSGHAGSSRGPAHGNSGAEPAASPPLARPPAGRVVAVGAQAEGIVAVPARRTIAVAVRAPTRIAVLGAGSGRVVRRLPIAGPARHLGLQPPATVLVPEAPIGRLLTLPLDGGHSRSIRTGELPHDAAAAGGRVFVADEFGRAVSVISDGREQRRIGDFSQPGGIAANQTGKDLALVDVSANMVSLIDAGARSERVIARARAGAGPTHDVFGPGGRLFVADTRGGALLAYAVTGSGARARLRAAGRLALPGTRPYGIAADPRRGRVWLTETATNELDEVSVSRAGTMRVARRYRTVRQPNSVAVDAASGRVFVAGAAAGVVQEIDSDGRREPW